MRSDRINPNSSSYFKEDKNTFENSKLVQSNLTVPDYLRNHETIEAEILMKSNRYGRTKTKATATITVAAYGSAVGAEKIKFSRGNIGAEIELTNGSEYAAATNNDTTATNIKNAINAKAVLTDKITATVDGAVVTLVCNDAGRVGNFIKMSNTTSAFLTFSYFSGGTNYVEVKKTVTKLDNQGSGKYEEGVTVTVADTLQDVGSTHDVDRAAAIKSNFYSLALDIDKLTKDINGVATAVNSILTLLKDSGLVDKFESQDTRDRFSGLRQADNVRGASFKELNNNIKDR